ncbi:hypothetical protein [Thermodesulforhabdus norvegica]|uniref:Uncharacterized protein n=1 Tax=Thermodesulforhabdus norvegica TaxID=39841 RepID=A0A1I4SVZ5_9BACT|nr:hypothetical protein [Thermodesulforhabdus norvegica]SFM68549.1 hypothetical protein SAMN05660836_01192 [Thermodesulforhabdus norvegica]
MNIYRRLHDVLSGKTFVGYGTVVDVRDGRLVVSLHGGGEVVVAGDASVGDHVIIHDRLVEVVPALPVYSVDL